MFFVSPVHAEMPVTEYKEPTIEEYIVQEFKAEGIDTSFVLDIVREESRFDTEAYNPEWHRSCQGSYGLFQIGCVNYSGNSADLFDYKLNTKLAIQVYKQQGWKAWGVCRTKVKCY